MMVLKKKLAIIGMSVIAFVCAIFGFMSFSNVKASAATTNNTADQVAFNFVSGASVRVTSGSTGLRFMASMSSEEYTALKANSAYESVSFGMIIVPQDYYEENAVTEENVFGDSAVYTFDQTDTTKTYVLNLTSDKLTDYRAKDTPTIVQRVFRGAITNLQFDLDKGTDNYSREFVAVAYIKTQTASGVDYVFTTPSEARSVVYVSQRALAEGETDTDGILSGFVSKVKDANITTKYTIEHQQEQEDGTYVAVAEDSQESSGVIGTKVTPTANEYDGYYVKTLEPTELLANDKTKIVVKYDLIKEISILTTAADLEAGNMQSRSANMDLTYYSGTDAIGGRTEGVFAWTRNSNTLTYQGLNFGNSTLNAQLAAGTYIYIDFYVPSDYSCKDIRAMQEGEGNGIQIANAASGDNWAWYDAATGAALTDILNDKTSSYWGRWVTLEYKLVKDNAVVQFDLWGYAKNNEVMYISNVRASVNGKLPIHTGAIEILTTKAHLDTSNMVSRNTDTLKLSNYASTEAAIGGRSEGIFAVQQVGTSTSGGCGLVFANTGLCETLKAGTYVYIDFYVPSDQITTTSNFFDMRVYNDNASYWWISNAVTGDNWTWYDSTGTVLTEKLNQSGSKSFDQWITLEYQLQIDCSCVASTSARFEFIYGFAENTTFYISNVRASTTKLDLTPAA